MKYTKREDGSIFITSTEGESYRSWDWNGTEEEARVFCEAMEIMGKYNALLEQLRWRTDLENSPKDGRPFEIKTSYPSVQACVMFFNGSDYESVIGTFIFPVNSKRLIGWREIPELPEERKS